MTDGFNEEFVEDYKRPDMITGLGILTFINSGLFLIFYLIGLLGVNGLSSVPEEELQAQLDEVFAQMGDALPADQMDQVYEVINIMKDNGVALMLTLLVLTALRFFGALKMWRGARQGFHIYAGSQVTRVLAPIIFFGAAGFSLFGLILAGLMTAGYASQLKHLR